MIYLKKNDRQNRESDSASLPVFPEQGTTTKDWKEYCGHMQAKAGITRK
jgi:hypothetical protein